MSLMFFEHLRSFVFRGQDEGSPRSNLEESSEKGKFNPRDVIYKSLSSVVSPHGVPSMTKSFETAVLILRIARSADVQLANCSEMDEFFELLKEVAINSGRISRQGFGSLKVLCIEGLSGSGKSTVVDGLVKRAGAILVGPMPPAKLKKVTDLLAGSPEPVLTALRFALNYCTAYRIISDVAAAAPTSGQSSDNRLVVVNKFYHSVCARTVCTNVKNDVDLKSLPASAFEWPLDLPTPSLVVFLMADGDCRSRRKSNMRHEALSHTPFGAETNKIVITSALLDVSSNASEELSVLNTRETTAYSLITGPPTIALDASQSAEDVLSAALEACEEFGLYTPPVLLRKKVNKRISMGVYGDLPVF